MSSVKASRARMWAAGMVSGSLILVFIGGVIALYEPKVLGGRLDAAVFVLAILLFSLIGGLVASRRPENPIGWILAGAGLAIAISGAGDFYARYTLTYDPGALPAGTVAAWISNMTGSIFFFLALTFTLQLFPDGKPLTPRWAFLLKATSVSMVVLLVGLAFAPGPLEDLPVAANPLGLPGTWGQVADAVGGLGWLLAMVCLLFSAASVVLRWRRARGDERQQLKWFGAAGIVLLIFMTTAFITEKWELLAFPLAAIPLAVGIAVLKYRLYDIDVVINKTIVFGLLAAFITGIYVAIVVGIGTLFGSQDEPNLALSIAATAVVAIAFSPVKERTQRLANRLVYGHRLSPYEILTDLSRTVATAPSPQDVLEGVARAAVTGMNSRRATVILHLHESGNVTVSFPPESEDEGGEALSRPVVHRGETLGELVVAKRATDPFSAHDRELMEDLSAQAGLALHNARLAIELQARLDEISRQAEELDSSRARIVSASDDSRRRLERDITEGPRHDLVAIQEELERAIGLMEHDHDAAAALLEGLTVRANHTLDALRELARGIYPPLLADKGIVAALEAHLRKHGLPVDVNADPAIAEARFDESIETVVFFCCVEALSESNGEGTSSFSLELTGDELRLSMDRVSLSESTWASVRDRVEAVGGSVQSAGGHLAIRVPCAMKEFSR